MSSQLLDEFFTEAQLAAELKRTPRTLADWRNKRIGPPVTRIGNCPIYRKESVRQWLAAREGKGRAG